jgi:predicted dehydrogenase
MVRTVRLMLLGAGAIAHKHAAAAVKLIGADRLELWIADPSEAARQAMAEAFAVARSESDSQALLDEPARDGDIVIVAAPPWLHESLTCAALESGRHVLCEKPLATSLPQALTMLAAARRAKRRLGCCSMRVLDHPPTRHVRQLIHDGRLGEIYHVRWIARGTRSRSGIEYQPQSRWFLDRSKCGGGIVHDWGPYDFTALNYLLDPVKVEVLSASFASPRTGVELPPGTVYDVEHHAIATLRYHRASGPPVTVSYERSACTHGQREQVQEIEGDVAAARFSWLDYADPQGAVVVCTDQGGKPVETRAELGLNPDMAMHERPLGLFMAAIAGRDVAAAVDEQAVFNYACLSAVDAAALTGETRTVTRQTFATEASA